MKAAVALGCLACALLAGCSDLPIAGPTAAQVVDQQIQNNHLRFNLIDIDQHVVRAVSGQIQPSFQARFEHFGKPPMPNIGVGDTVSVTIWQATATPGMTSGTSGSEAGGATIGGLTIPVQVVGPDGGITVPYAGRVPAAGRQPVQVQREIEHRLAQKMAAAQVLVTVVNSVNDVLSVTGEVVDGKRVPLPLNGERLLDVIAAAGGAKAPVYETFVRLSRRGVTVTIPMERLISEPAENIYGWPGDVLTLIRRPRTYTVFGAIGRNAELPFETENLSLAEAIAKAGGLVDQQADPTGVFLLRYEPQPVVRALHLADLATDIGGSSPVVFRLNLRDAKSYLLAQNFPVENKDILYVANAPLTIPQKLFSLLSTLSGPIISGFAVTRP